jgi:hypothetical protein
VQRHCSGQRRGRGWGWLEQEGNANQRLSGERYVGQAIRKQPAYAPATSLTPPSPSQVHTSWDSASACRTGASWRRHYWRGMWAERGRVAAALLLGAFGRRAGVVLGLCWGSNRDDWSLGYEEGHHELDSGGWSLWVCGGQQGGGVYTWGHGQIWAQGVP